MDEPAQASNSAPPVSEREFSGSKTSLFRRRRPLFWLALAFCCGIAAEEILAPPLSSLGGLFLAIFFAAAASIFLRSSNSKTSGPSPLASLRLLLCGLAVAASSGALLHALRARVPAADDVSRQT